VRANPRNKWPLAAACVLFVLGAWQLGQGIYIHAKAVVAQVLLHRAWDRTLAGEPQTKPWSWADTWPVARLVVPDRDVDVLILAGSNGRTIAFGPGHVFGTPLPGEPGNSVVGGHRDTNLSFLEDISIGTEISVQRPNGVWMRYRVQSIAVVDQHDTWVMASDNSTRLTLITCYPFNALRAGGPLRYIVTAAAYI
jgi:sortase A